MHLEATEADIRHCLAVVRARIEDACDRVGREADAVKVLAATKYVGPAGVAALHAAGVDILGENRVEALAEKVEHAPDGEWHFIGRLQSRQVGRIAPYVSCIETLASARSALRLAEAGGGNVLIQVNTAADPAKSGIQADEVEQLLDELPRGVTACGFMTMPAWTDSPESSREAFAALRELRDRLAARWDGRHSLRELSMGTTQDFLIAVEEGATIVRLGRVLFVPDEL